MLLHDKYQHGATSDKALIQKIPHSFAENPNEDLKCSAGRRPGGCRYTLPLLALRLIVSLSPYWPSLAGDERDMTARRASVHRPHACMAPREGQIPQSAANIQNDIKQEMERQKKRQKLLTKDAKTKKRFASSTSTVLAPSPIEY